MQSAFDISNKSPARRLRCFVVRGEEKKGGDGVISCIYYSHTSGLEDACSFVIQVNGL